MTRGNEWRESLKEGDRIDCCDTMQNWYQATILNRREIKVGNELIKEVQVGFRFYNENGLRIDQNGRKFTGWSSNYDEWINLYSIRIQRFIKKAIHFVKRRYNCLQEIC